MATDLILQKTFAVASVQDQRTVLMQVINSLIFTDAPIWKEGAVQADKRDAARGSLT